MTPYEIGRAACEPVRPHDGGSLARGHHDAVRTLRHQDVLERPSPLEVCSPLTSPKLAANRGATAGRRGGNAMARTYREIATEDMLRTVEEAMRQVINWWGDLPPPMKEAIEQFRTQLGEAIDSVELVKRALDRQVHETDRGRGPA
jgi:hypothetical protein